MTKSKMSSRMPPKGVRRVIAIDPGFDRIGIAVLEENQVLFSECFQTNRKDTYEKRLFALGERVRKVISEFKPQSLALETLFFNQNTSSAMHVAEARGVIVYEAMCQGLELYEYSPQAVKIAVTGYGKADKLQVTSMVTKLVKLDARKVKRIDDELDAVALGITHLATLKGI